MWRFAPSSDSDGHPLLRSLNNHVGRQVWVYDPDGGTPEERERVEQARAKFKANRFSNKDSGDELLRIAAANKRRSGPFPVAKESFIDGSGSSDEKIVIDALRNGISFYESLQCDDGHWPGDYGGPMFLLPGMVIACYTTGVLDTVFSPAHKKEVIRYLANHQNEDGGYGLHIEGTSTMFGTALTYVTLRLLGMGPDDPVVSNARSWIHSRGGAQSITSWGKLWLAVLGVYSWDGLNPMPPEMWLLPYSAWTGIGLVHPGRFWCHCRMVYLPMSYIYGSRATAKPSPLTTALREELYTVPYEQIHWDSCRNLCAKEDLYYPHPWVQDVLWWALTKTERFLLGSKLRGWALAECMRLIHYEDENTRYIDIGPVNKVLNMLCCWFENPDSEEYRRHIPRLHDYLWVAEDGMKMQGYNGSQLWDTAFAIQAIVETGLAPEFSRCMQSAAEFIKATQVVEEAQQPLAKYYRHISKGAWPFSTRDHGWPISDCSSEGLKAALMLARLGSKVGGRPIEAGRLFDCVNVILSYQNGCGGWATYENTRSYPILETINPSETFGDIVIDYSYVECSSACITALTAFRAQYPDHRREEIEVALRRGIRYIKDIQRKDGSWYGSWGVCFTYGTWFGLEALAAVGEIVTSSSTHASPAYRACKFLLSKQREDGGWGETYLSCQDKVYSQFPEGQPSHVVNTAWAMLGLIAAGWHHIDRKPLDAAAKFLIRAQEENGDWPMQHISGVFNRNCAITYANYRNIFPIWALGKYAREVVSD